VRVFVDPERLVLGSLILRGDEHHYLSRVRRARPGDVIELVDGAGNRARAVIEAITTDATTLRVETPETIPALPPFVRALVPLIKGDRMDTCIEKLVEVGVDAIVVWPAARSVVRLHDDRRDARIAKLQAAAQAAARQCGRAQVPQVTATIDLGAALAGLPETIGLVCDPLAETTIGDALQRAACAILDVTIASGPEGGLAPDELHRLAAFSGIGLGPRILRAETAPVIAVALVRAATRS